MEIIMAVIFVFLYTGIVSNIYIMFKEYNRKKNINGPS